MRGISYLAEDLLASEEGLCYMESTDLLSSVDLPVGPHRTDPSLKIFPPDDRNRFCSWDILLDLGQTPEIQQFDVKYKFPRKLFN